MSTNRIVKNTYFLYLRMILIMLLSLFTVRIVLKALGVVDYGIYNVVAGMVTMLSFLTGTMTSASLRFFAFEIGKNNHTKLKQVFSTTLNIYFIIAIVILILAESVGLWFLNTKMNIPDGRMDAVNWVYQFSIFSFLATIIAIPYTASIIAHEQMKIYAYIGIVEVILKLVMVYLLLYSPFDKLVSYAFLMFSLNLVISLAYREVCIRKFESCRYQFIWNKKLMIPILNYASWNMIGAIANILKNNGSNILLNIYFGPVINAARGIAFQINTAITSFVSNFYMASRPGITKAYSAGDNDHFMQLVFQTAKFSFYLLLIISVPIFLETQYILEIWLGDVPQYANIFTKLFIITILIETVNNQLVAALQASGNIKKYQLIVSIMQLLILPISYILLKMNYPPEAIMYVSIIIALLTFIPQLLISHEIVGLPIFRYLKEVVFLVTLVSIISIGMPALLHCNMDYGFKRFIIVSCSSIVITILTIFTIGLSKNEREKTIFVINNKLKSKK